MKNPVLYLVQFQGVQSTNMFNNICGVLMFIQRINKFCKEISLYPPIALFNNTQNPTTQEKRVEQRIISICEDMYKLDSHFIRELRTAYDAAALCELFIVNLKDTYLIKSCAQLTAHMKFVHTKLETMHKKDPILMDYFSKIKLQKDEFNLPWQYVAEHIKEIEVNIASQTFKEIYNETLNNLKNS